MALSPEERELIRANFRAAWIEAYGELCELMIRSAYSHEKELAKP